MAVDAGLLTELYVALLSVPSNGNKKSLGHPRELAESARHLIAIQSRQANVQKDHIVRVGRGRIESAWTIVGGDTLVAPLSKTASTG